MQTIRELQKTTQKITGRASLPVTKLNSISRDHKAGTTPIKGRDYDAIKIGGNWYLTGDYTTTTK